MDVESRARYPPLDGLDALGPLRMTWPGVVSSRRRVARNYNLHLLTLAQVRNLLRVEGSWPGTIDLKAGWLFASARPWNEEITDPMVRLGRGGTEFLRAVTDKLIELGAEEVYSPALYAGATGVWRRSGYHSHVSLDVMELVLGRDRTSGYPDGVREVTQPDWDQVLDIDRTAFEGFWGMSRFGLEEAHQTNRSTALLVTGDDRLTGYAIVGSQWGTIYLHRIAVHADHTGRGLGRALLDATIRWGSRSGGRSMILNVRPDNDRARRLYRRLGFSDTGTSLEVLRYAPSGC